MSQMNQKRKVVIIDDEKLARDRLRKLLLPYANRIDIIGEASDGQEGLVLVESLKPEIIFLDVQMPLMDGFQMLGKISYDARIIFTTAYDQYAIRAFEESALDYLLKPIEQERLNQSIHKLEQLSLSEERAQLQELLQRIGNEELKTITVSLGNRMILLKVEDIVYFHAEDKYVFVHHVSGKKHLLSSSLIELEKKLGDSFIRVHRAYIINRDHIKEISKSVNGKLNFLMHGDEQIMSSHSYTPVIRKLLQL